MGNVNHRIRSEDRQYPFVGREREIEKILKDINGKEKLVVQIHGIQEIGTSRVLTQTLKECHEKRNCILVEFFGNSLNCANIKELLVKLQEELNLKRLLNTEELQNLPSHDLTTVIDEVVKQLESLDEPTLLFVDDAHKVRDDQFKRHFLHFLNKVCNSQTDKFKVIFTASEKVRLASKAFSDREVRTLRRKEIRELFVSVIKEKGTNDDDDSDDEEDSGKDSDEEEEDDNADKSLASIILSKSNKKFVDALVELCEGLPKVAIMIGSELTANNGLLEPKDMIVLLINDRLVTLSPECYPDLDKADTYKKALQNLMKKRRDLIDAFNSKMGTDNTASIHDISEVHGTVSTAEAKHEARMVVDNNVMQYDLKNRKFKMCSIFRDCLLAMKHLLTEEDKDIKHVLKHGRLELAKLPGAPKGIADDTRVLEKFLNDLQDHQQEIDRRQDSKEPTEKEKETKYFSLRYSPGKLMIDHAGMEICSFCHRPFHVYNNYVDNVNMDTCTCSKKRSEKDTNSGYDSLGGPHALGPVSLGECDSDGDGTGRNNLGRMCNGSEYPRQAVVTKSLNISEENEGSRGVFEASNEANLSYSWKEINGKDEMVDQRVDQGKEEGVIQDAGLAAETLTSGIATKVEGSIRDKPTMILECQKLEVDSQGQKHQGNLNLPFEKLDFDGERKDGIRKELVKTGSLKVPKRLENGESEEFGKMQNNAGLLSPDTGFARSLNDSD